MSVILTHGQRRLVAAMREAGYSIDAAAHFAGADVGSVRLVVERERAGVCLQCGDYAPSRGLCCTCRSRAERAGVLGHFPAKVKPRVSESERQEMRRMRAEGWTISAIARETRRSWKTVSKVLLGEKA